jgi:hypothetical protein
MWGTMPEAEKKSFEWNELVEIFSIREGEYKDKDRECIMQRLNTFAGKYGKDYVIRKIALKRQQQG